VLLADFHPERTNHGRSSAKYRRRLDHQYHARATNRRPLSEKWPSPAQRPEVRPAEWSTATLFHCLALVACRLGSLAARLLDALTSEFHNRQVVVLDRADWLAWLDLARAETDLLRPLPAGSLTVEQIR
jgi:hypothetical protein